MGKVNLQVPFESLVEAIASLGVEEKRQLQAIIAQQILTAEAALNEEDGARQAEAQVVQVEYAANEYLTM